MKRTVSFGILVLIAAVGFARGAAEPPAAAKSSPVSPAGEFPILIDSGTTFTFLRPRNPTAGSFDQLWHKELFEHLMGGPVVAIEVERQAWNERLRLAFATQNLPDLVIGSEFGPADEVRYGLQGALVPLNDLIDRYSMNLVTLLSENPSYRQSMTLPDGNIYSFPSVPWFEGFPSEGAGNRSWINTAWLQKLGLEIPRTLEEFYRVLVAFRDADDLNGNGLDDEIPIGDVFDRGMGGIKAVVLGALGLVDDRLAIDPDSGRVTYAPSHPAFRDYLVFMNRLYSDGLIDRDMFVQSLAQFRAKGSPGTYGVFADGAPFLVVGTDPVKFGVYEAVRPLTSARNPQPVWRARPKVQSGTAVIPVVSKHPEAAFRLMDYFYSEDGSVAAIYGPEDGTWDAGPGGWVRTENGRVIQPDREGFANTFAYTIARLTLHVDLPFVCNQFWADLVQTPNATFWRTQANEHWAPHYRESFPNVYLTEDEFELAGTIQADLDSYVTEMESKFISGSEPLANWDRFVRTISEIGGDELVAIYQKAFDRQWSGAQR